MAACSSAASSSKRGSPAKGVLRWVACIWVRVAQQSAACGAAARSSSNCASLQAAPMFVAAVASYAYIWYPVHLTGGIHDQKTRVEIKSDHARLLETLMACICMLLTNKYAS